MRHDPVQATALWCRALTADLSGVEAAPLEVGAPGPGEARLAVRAAALNFPDLLMTRGLYQHKPQAPFVLGMEGCGIVEAHGAGVDKALLGQRMCFRVRNGAFATRLLLPAQALSPAPAGLDDFEAAACAVTALTAWVSLVRQAQLRAGESVLVHGAGGGVGLASVQLARHLGAQVIATASRMDKLAAARKAGADFGVVLQPGWDQQVLALNNGEGVDVCLDPVGGEAFETSVRCMAWAGRMLAVGFADGRIPRIALDQILLRELSVLGVRAGEWGRRNPAAALDDAQQIRALLDRGILVPPIGACFPLHDGVYALRAMAGRKVAGKICLSMP